MARSTSWIDILVSLQCVDGGDEAETLTTGTSVVDTRGMTLIRTILRLDMFLTSVAGAYGAQRIALGIMIASQEAFATGITARPDPRTAADFPPRGWIYRNAVAVSQNGVSTNFVTTVTADIRGVRKVEKGELILIVQSDALVGTAFTTNVRGIVRCLFKLE